MSESIQSLLSSWAKDPASSMKEVSSFLASNLTTMKEKAPMELLIDYHNFWARTARLDALIVDKSQDMSMDKLSEAFTKVAEEMKNTNITQMWEAMVAWRQTVTVTEIAI
eukprot:TRINITY_DN25958_c0_g1_i1.p1 TRINITY_DN25958_c0_g1~~TRINITY_DN25958_c0_g1_i1.p1  ORF type:complete len:110 (-),score=44.06 TRINITY_DN25958_c0_g1_i1:42-371(-)